MEYIWDLLVNLHWGAVGQIIMIDILLGGDNAVVIPWPAEIFLMNNVPRVFFGAQRGPSHFGLCSSLSR